MLLRDKLFENADNIFEFRTTPNFIITIQVKKSSVNTFFSLKSKINISCNDTLRVVSQARRGLVCRIL